jgi:hypothetical protein
MDPGVLRAKVSWLQVASDDVDGYDDEYFAGNYYIGDHIPYDENDPEMMDPSESDDGMDVYGYPPY